MNLIKKYTIDGVMWVDADQLAEARGQRVRIYNSRGQLRSEVARSNADRLNANFGVYPSNLFDSREECIEASNQFYSNLNKVSP